MISVRSETFARIILVVVFFGMISPIIVNKSYASELSIKGPFYKYLKIRNELLANDKIARFDIDGVHVLLSFANGSKLKLFGLASILLGNVRAVEREILSEYKLNMREDYIIESFLDDIVLDDLRDYLFL